MKTSEALDKLAPALVKAQAHIEGAAKDGKGNYGKYATLGSVVDACKAALLAEGITFVQTFVPSDVGTLRLSTSLLHTSGQYISGECTVPLPRNDPQSYGSAATYARRYSLAAIVGVCPEDDDGQGAMPQRQQQRPAPPRSATPTNPASVDQVREIKSLLGRVTLPEGTVDKWLAKAGVNTWEQMPADVVTKCIQYAKGKLPAAPAA